MKKIIFLFSTSLIFTLSCNNDATVKNSEENDLNTVQLTSKELAEFDFQTDTIKKMLLQSVLHFKGIIDVPPQNIHAISVPMGGYLKETHLLPGTPIKKGQIIAKIEDVQYIQLQEEYLNTKIQLKMLETNYKRQKALLVENAISEKIYEQAETEYLNAKTKLKALEEKLYLININPTTLTPETMKRSINIIAPFDGYAIKINYSVGKYITPSDVLFELVNPSDIHLNLKIYEKDLENITIGQKLVAYTTAQPNKKFNCAIILINKLVNSDRTVDVHCHFDKYEETLIPGTYMQADVFIKNDSVYALPSSAVIFYDNKYHVFIQKTDHTFEMKSVILSNYQNNGFIGIENHKELLKQKIVSSNVNILLMKLKNRLEE